MRKGKRDLKEENKSHTHTSTHGKRQRKNNNLKHKKCFQLLTTNMKTDRSVTRRGVGPTPGGLGAGPWMSLHKRNGAESRMNFTERAHVFNYF